MVTADTANDGAVVLLCVMNFAMIFGAQGSVSDIHKTN